MGEGRDGAGSVHSGGVLSEGGRGGGVEQDLDRPPLRRGCSGCWVGTVVRVEKKAADLTQRSHVHFSEVTDQDPLQLLPHPASGSQARLSPQQSPLQLCLPPVLTLGKAK